LPDFARFFEKRPPTWSACWCVAFHMKPGESPGKAAQNRAYKERLVRANQSHAALVYDGADVVGWCQFGPPAELPSRMRGYGKLGAAIPDWRITCLFVDRDRRREGIAKAALSSALRIIAAKGGGTVDGYPISIPRGKPYSSSFLWSGTESMFAEAGFRPLGHLGTSKLVMRKMVRPRHSVAPSAAPRSRT
jgi:GNAT superfamily N-acetyltransferase